MSQLEPHLQQVVESLCHHGCKAVRQHILDIEHGQLPAPMNPLSFQDRMAVLLELKDIMAVYDRCEL